MAARKVDLIVIGAGSGGLSVASGAAQLGLSVVLYEKGLMGGDCLNYGCVPSKALIAAADAAHQVRNAGRLGVNATPQIDFKAVMAHVHQVITVIEPHDSQARFEGLGVTVVREAARFTGPKTVASDSGAVMARKIVVATGSRAKIPPIPGLGHTPYLTNETVFDLETLPQRLLILGGGPIGLELGQAFRRLGSEVVILDVAPPMAKEDPELAAPVLEQMAQDGVEVLAPVKVLSVSPTPDGVEVVVEDAGAERRLIGSHLLVCTGRTPSVEGLDLERAGIAYDEKGIHTDRSLRTSNKAVFAIGDVAGRQAFTHVAGAHAGLVVRKALFASPVNADALVVPRVTYTDPELAVVGLTEAQARKAHGAAVKVIVQRMSGNDRAQAEGDTRGLAKLVTGKGGAILGVGIAARGAGDLIHAWTKALATGEKLGSFTAYIAPYPTRGEINKRLAGDWYTPILFAPRTRKLVSLLKRIA